MLYADGNDEHAQGEREMENMQESLKQAVDAIDNQAQIYENLIDYLSYSGDLRKVLKMERASDFNTYLEVYSGVRSVVEYAAGVSQKKLKGSRCMRIIFRLPMEVHWLLCRRFREKTGIPETTEV